MSSTISYPSFPHFLFTQLAYRLRNTNARYDQIAYQCRRARHPTYHAKRRAYRVGLRIDTSKAYIACAHSPVLVFGASPQALPVLADSSMWATETEAGMGVDHLPNPWPDTTVVARERLATPLSPLELVLGNIDDVNVGGVPLRGEVPDAPLWRSIPLPPDECSMETMKNRSVSYTCDPIWQGVVATHVSDLTSMSMVNTIHGGPGVAPTRHLKRKQKDVDIDGDVMYSRRSEAFVGARWAETRRRRDDL